MKSTSIQFTNVTIGNLAPGNLILLCGEQNIVMVDDLRGSGERMTLTFTEIDAETMTRVEERDGNMTVWSKARVDRLKTWCIHCGSQCSGSAYFCSVGCDESFKGDYPSVPITRDPQRQTPAMGDPGAESPPGDAGKFNTANIVTSANNDGVTITRTITWDRVRDILCNALEGGSNYWYHIKKFVEPPGGLKPWKDEKRTFRHLDCPLSEGGAIHVVDAGEEEEDREVYVVNRESLARAIRLMAEKFPAYLEEIIEENDDGDTGDCLLQLACFGEMRLG